MNSIGTSRECAATQPGSARYVWRIPGVPVQIRIGMEVVRRIREYLAAQLERSPASEAGGLLLGKPHPPGVEIDDFVPVFRDAASGPHFVFSDVEKPDLRNRIEVANGLGSELSVIGYFRSDVREGIRLYEDDLAIIKESFAHQSNVFLIIRPGEAPHPTAGFFFWEGDCIFSSFSFMEFSFHESVLASAAYTPDSATVPDGNGKRGQQPNALLPVSGVSDRFKRAPVEEVREAAQGPRPTRRWAVCAGIVVILGLGAYFLVPRLVVSSPTVTRPVLARTGFPPSSLGLSVFRSGTDLTIAWNGQAKLVTDARVGMLAIEDGNARLDLPLTQAQLRSSRLIYTPINDRVQIALEIFAQDGKVTRENVIALSNAAEPATPAADARPSNPLAGEKPSNPLAGEKPSNPLAGEKPSNPLAGEKPYRVEVPLDRSSPPSQPPAESQVRPRNPARDFIPPVVGMGSEAALAIAPAEPPPALAPRMDIPRIDLPAVRPAAPKALSEKPSQSLETVSQQVRQTPVPLRQARPVLPPNVKAMLTGRVSVKVRIQVDATGKVDSAEPLDRTGSLGRFLGSAAASAARTWTFEPATLNGQKVPGELTVEFIFVPDR